MQEGISKSDVNRLLSFTKDPTKYAIDTHSAKEKVCYLDTISYKFSPEQRAMYKEAREQYDAALATKKEPRIQKMDYSPILDEGLTHRRSVKIRYKNVWRMIDPYALNETYVVAYCHSALDIRTFRMDRIQGAELSENFSFNRSLQTTAQSRLMAAPS